MTRPFYIIILLSNLIFLSNGVYADMDSNSSLLPKTFGKWSQSEPVRTITSKNIFEYMNGGGELYLAYGFEQLEVMKYTIPDQPEILVEIYVMKTSADAFGLLSLDWGGESVKIGPLLAPTEIESLVLSPNRYLYGSGLLRIAVDRLYIRILSFQDTPEVREAILFLGQTICKNRPPCPEPEFIQKLPKELIRGYTLRKDRVGYFSSYLILNMLYYISHQDILNLDHSIQAVFAPYEINSHGGDKKTIKYLMIQYTDRKNAEMALKKFHEAYLPEFSNGYIEGGKVLQSNVYTIEDGIVGYKLADSRLTILFELPDKAVAASILQEQ
jgi:hypothetical protein